MRQTRVPPIWSSRPSHQPSYRLEPGDFRIGRHTARIEEPHRFRRDRGEVVFPVVLQQHRQTCILQLPEVVEKRRPKTIVELGSGMSTLWLAYALESLGEGRVIALDHDEHHFAETVAEVRHAPLGDAGLPDHDTPWYTTSAFEDLDAVDLLLVDGPPQATGKSARYPDMPAFLPKLAAGAFVILDDIDRRPSGTSSSAGRASTPDLPRPASPVRAAVRRFSCSERPKPHNGRRRLSVRSTCWSTSKKTSSSSTRCWPP